MPFGLHLLTGLSVFVPIFALILYVRDQSQAHVGLPKILLIAICCAAFIYGFLQATGWSRPLVVLWLAAASIWAIFQNHATYSFSDYLGLLGTVGFIVWILYFRGDVRAYYLGAHKPVG